MVFIIFSKPPRKHFSVLAYIFDKVAQLIFFFFFWLFFFISYSRLQLHNKRVLARVPVNFETFLRFHIEYPKANTFAPFRFL